MIFTPLHGCILVVERQGEKGIVTEVSDISQQRLLQALAEQLKLPLLHIARAAELSSDTQQDSLQAITETAQLALQVIDSYLLSNQLSSQQTLELEPVSLAAVLADTAQRLSYLAKQYNYDLELSLAGKYEPVMARQDGLLAALTMLGYAMIATPYTGQGRARLLLGAHRSQRGIVAGLFADQSGLSADMFRRARALYGTARQPFTSLSPSAGAGVFVADTLCATMATQLQIAHHHKLPGLAATFLPSHQLKLV